MKIFATHMHLQFPWADGVDLCLSHTQHTSHSNCNSDATAYEYIIYVLNRYEYGHK